MKKLILILVLLPFISVAQLDTSWNFSKVIELDSISKDRIFAVAKEYFLNHGMGSNKNFVLEISTGKITGAGAFPVILKSGMARDKGMVVYSFKFLSKDGKCKLELFNFIQSLSMANGGSLTNEKPDCGNFAISQKAWIGIKEISRERAEFILSDFERTMKNLIVKQEEF